MIETFLHQAECFSKLLDNAVEKSRRDFEWQLRQSKCNGFIGKEDKEAGEVVVSPC
jgi:hypothetical protein